MEYRSQPPTNRACPATVSADLIPRLGAQGTEVTHFGLVQMASNGLNLELVHPVDL